MIKRIAAGLILVIGLTSVYAQDGIPAIRSPSAEADCAEEASIVPTCLFSRKEAKTPAEMVTNDLGVCACLAKSNTIFENLETQSTSEQFEAEKKRLVENLNAVAGNSSVLQASSSSKTKEQQDISLMTYGGQEIRANLKKREPSSTKPQTNPGPSISNSLSRVNLIPEDNKDWQCVTYQEYSLQRELPSDNDFFALLSESEFKPEEWNPNILASKFDTANEKDKDTIRLKLSFLSRNPIFQTIMKAEETKKFSAAKILDKQKELYNILRLLKPAPGSTCSQVPNKCFQELLSNGQYQTYTNEVSRFLMDYDVIDMASAQAASDYDKELKRITEAGEQTEVGSVPTSPEGYFNYLQTSNQQLLRECTGQEVKAECYTKFGAHCTHIQAIDKRVREGIRLKGGEIASILREEESVHATLDPNKNANFRAFNEKICLDPYANRSGEKLNYFQYQAKYCSGPQQIPECSDRKKLLTKFLDEYNQGEIEADKNLRTAFSKIVSDKKFQAISEAQVVAANNISESPAELRARFGGSFPSISPKGTLIPPQMPKSQVASSAQASNIPDYSDIYSDSSGRGSKTSSRRQTISEDAPSAIRDRVAIGSGQSQVVSSYSNPVVPLRDKPTISNLPAYSPTVSEDSSVSQIKTRPTRDQGSVDETPSAQTPEQSSGGSGGNSLMNVASSAGTASVGAGRKRPATEIETFNPNVALRKRNPASESNYLFKYGLDGENRPEVNLINPADNSEVKVSVDRRLLDRIRSNPNSFEIGKEDMDKIMATPDEEVKLLIGSKDGSQELVIYARKDSTGGLSFALTPSKSKSQNKDVMRVNVLPEVHESIIRDPDVYLNQNPTIMQEVLNKEGKTKKLLLQVVSPGKRALVFEVKKKDDYLYTFKRVGP